MALTTRERIESAEIIVKSAFARLDSAAALHTKKLPPQGNTPAQRLAHAVEARAIQDAAPGFAQQWRAMMAKAITDATKALDDVADEAAMARWAARYVRGECSDLPEGLADHLKSAAMAVRGQPGATIVANALTMAAGNADDEVTRMRKRWLERTRWAALAAAANRTEKLFSAAGLDRSAKAAGLLHHRYELMRKASIERATRKRMDGHE